MQDNTITQIQIDGGCDFYKILLPTYGSLLTYIFHNPSDPHSQRFLQNLQSSIPIFGEYDNVKYYSLSSEKCPLTIKKFQVERLPSIIFTDKDQKIIDRYDGDDVGCVFDMLDRLSGEYKTRFERDRTIWQQKIKNIIQSCPFVVFTIGTPQNPQCGFTKRLVQLLNNKKIQYVYYDAYKDEQLAHWAKYFSKWPTFPQLYINRKLIGGYNDTKKLDQNNQFDKLVPASSRSSSPAQRYTNFITEHGTVVFIDGFAFENKTSEAAVNEARKRFGEDITIYNIALDNRIKDYVKQNISANVPFVVHGKQVVKD